MLLEEWITDKKKDENSLGFDVSWKPSFHNLHCMVMHVGHQDDVDVSVHGIDSHEHWGKCILLLFKK